MRSDTLVDAPMAVSAIHPDERARVAAAWEASLAGFPASSSNSSCRVVRDGTPRHCKTGRCTQSKCEWTSDGRATLQL
jgi:hypothetical protein